MRHIKVKVSTGTKKEEIIEITSKRFECFVREKPERNLANKKALELLADYLKVEKGKLKIISGHHSPGKIILLDE